MPGDHGDVKWYDSNLPADTPRHRLVALAHSRWPIEPCYEDAKGECGLDDYQGRRCAGLQRHRALVRRASRFLACQCWTPAAPAGQRQVLGWLFQDVVLWLIATDQITQVRPRQL